ATGSHTTITQSTVSGNTAEVDGGGIYDLNGTLALTNSTVSGNSAPRGGGLFVDGSAATINSSTLAANTATSGGGGFYRDGTVGTLRCKNSTGADNSATLPAGGLDCNGTGVQSYGFNLIETITACSITPVANVGTDVYGQDPLLGALAGNGGATQTHLPAAGSPVIDQGSRTPVAGGVLTADQRGQARPSDWPGVANEADGCDVGAVEVLAGAATHTLSGVVTEGGAPVSGVLVSLTGSSIASTTTGAAGAYSFTVAAGGDYTVTPAKAGKAFAPASLSFDDVAADQVANFAVTPTGEGDVAVDVV